MWTCALAEDQICRETSIHLQTASLWYLLCASLVLRKPWRAYASPASCLLKGLKAKGVTPFKIEARTFTFEQICEESSILWQIAEAVGDAERSASKTIAGPVISLLDSAPADLWTRLNRLIATNIPRHSQVSYCRLSGHFTQYVGRRHVKRSNGTSHIVTSRILIVCEMLLSLRN